MSARSTNLVHSAFFLVLTFLGVAGIYVLLNADYLAVVQVLIYIGAISILLVFGVMLTRRGDVNESNLFNRYKNQALVVTFGLFVIMAVSAVMTQWKVSTAEPPQSTIMLISNILLNEQVIPFEAAGILLLSALIGAIIIGKGVNNSK
jgi:NADH-quinone oxidoreductase subunit J